MTFDRTAYMRKYMKRRRAGQPASRLAIFEAALRQIAGNGDATGCNPQIMCDIAVEALRKPD